MKKGQIDPTRCFNLELEDNPMNVDQNNAKITHDALNRVKRLFAFPRLLYGENGDDYTSVETTIRAHIKPLDGIEEIWVSELVAVQWDIIRLRRQVTALINASVKSGLARIFESIAPYEKDESLTRAEHAEMLAERWFTDNEARRKLDALMERFDLDPPAAMQAEALASRLPQIEAIHRIAASFVRQRDALWQQIYARREKLGKERAQLADVHASPMLPEGKMPQIGYHNALNGQQEPG